MQHAITIEHGEGLRDKCTIHEQVLCKHSEKMRVFAARAEPLREAHAKCDEYLECIESVTMVKLSVEQSSEEKLKARVRFYVHPKSTTLTCEQLLPLIMNIYKHCPLPEHEKALQSAINNILTTQFSNKNLRPSAEKPKNTKAFHDLSLNQRLHFLNSEGLLEVVQEVGAQLSRLKAAERQKAKNNVNKAWAQSRLILRNASRTSVLSLANWAYNGILRYEDAEQLYDLWALAERLKFDVLAEECMTRIYDIASASLSKAFSNGVPLGVLLGLTHEQDTTDATAQSNDVVAAVFHHVLKDDKTPEKLTELIIDALARGMDTELWLQVQDMINPDIKNVLINLMIVYRDIKVEGGLDDGGGPVKPESTEAQQSVLTG